MQITGLSTRAADGSYREDLGTGIDNVVGFALDIFAEGEDPETVTIATVTAELYRYRKDYERTSPTIADRVLVVVGTAPDDELVTEINGDNVNITIPADALEVGQTYHLKIIVTDDDGIAWVRTREYRAVS